MWNIETNERCVKWVVEGSGERNVGKLNVESRSEFCGWSGRRRVVGKMTGRKHRWGGTPGIYAEKEARILTPGENWAKRDDASLPREAKATCMHEQIDPSYSKRGRTVSFSFKSSRDQRDLDKESPVNKNRKWFRDGIVADRIRVRPSVPGIAACYVSKG